MRIGGAPGILDRGREIDVTWGPVTLGELAIAPRTVEVGDRIVVDLGWTAGWRDEAVVFVHLVGPPKADGGRVWSTGDGPPSSGTWGYDRHLLDVPPDAPSGEYEIVVGLYRPESGERLLPEGEDRRIDGAARQVVLGTVTVR